MKGTPIAPGLIQTEAFDIPAEPTSPAKEKAPRAASGGRSDAGPGYARFTGEDTRRDVERKMREAFAPVRATLEGLARAVDPHHRWRDTRTGRFVPKRRP